MPRATWTQSNFNGGEWSPLMYGRFDLPKYKAALAQCFNYLPTQQGGLTRRPGSRYVAGVKSDGVARLQRFEFSVTQAYQLEFGAGYIRFYANDGQLQVSSVPAWNAGGYNVGDLASLGGFNYYCIAAHSNHSPPNASFWYPLTGTIFEIPTPYLAGEVFALQFTQSADTLYIAHPLHAPMKLQRFGATNWTLTAISFVDGPYLAINATPTTLTPSGSSGAVTVTASAVTGINGGLGFQNSDIGRVLRIKFGGLWLWGTITAVADTTHCTWTIAAATGAQVSATATATANVSGNSVQSITITNGGAGYGASPPSVTISGGGGSGAVAVATVNNGVTFATGIAGSVTSIAVTATGTGYTSTPTVTVTTPVAPVPSTTTFWRLSEWCSTNGYPGAVTFHQDRLTWGGCTQFPSRIDASNTADYENMSPTNIDGTVVDSNALAFSLSSNSVNVIQWIVSDEFGLIAGTAGGEWVVAPTSLQTALTPTNVNAKLTTQYGASPVAPVRVGKAALYVQRTGRKIREMTFQYLVNTFQAPDISLLGEHLTKSGIKQMALQLSPQQVVWMVRNDGTFVAMTYDKDQDICGFHGHQLGGFSDAGQTAQPLVESVSTNPAPGTQRDEVWVIVNRYINGVTKRYVETLAKTWEDGDVLSGCVFLDASAQYSGAPTTTVSGLTWLVGQTVGVLGDGATHPDCVVNNSGVITLQRNVSIAQVGLKYTSAGKTMKPEAGGAEGPAQGKIKRVYRAVFRFFQSIGMIAVPTTPNVVPYPQPFRSSADQMDGPVALFTGDKRWSWENTWESDGQIAWQQTDPLPHNITMVMAQLETMDDQ